MTKICRESEASLDYSALFRGIIKRAPSPMSPLESLASSAVRTAHKASPFVTFYSWVEALVPVEGHTQIRVRERGTEGGAEKGSRERQ